MIKKRYIKVLIFVLILSFIFIQTSQADVGGFQRYDSGSSSSYSSSSYDSWGSDYDSDGDLGWILWIISLFIHHPLIGMIVVVGFVIFWSLNKDKFKHRRYPRNIDYSQYRNQPVETPDNSKYVVEQIRDIDPDFSEENFLAWTKEVFVKLQNAWTAREWGRVRPFENDELYQQHMHQLQEFIDRKKINIIERIAVNYARLEEFRVDGNAEILTVRLKSTMKDYIIDEVTQKVLEGDKHTDRVMTYKLVFSRKPGVKTKPETSNKSTTNCPNCGAPAQITSAGECEYCHSIVTSGDHDWVLTNLESI